MIRHIITEDNIEQFQSICLTDKLVVGNILWLGQEWHRQLKPDIKNEYRALLNYVNEV